MRVPLVVVLAIALTECAPVTEETVDLMARLGAAPPAERDHLLRDAIATNGGTPIVEGDTAHFFVENRSGDPPPRLVADFNEWGQFGDGAMTRLDGTSWFYLTETLHPSARIEYAIAPDPTDDGNLRLDPENPRTVEGFSRLYSELRMPGYADPPELVEDPSLPRGRLVEAEFESRIRANRRKVFVYLPPGYTEDGERRYPTAYFGDGEAYVSNPPVPRILDHAIAHGVLAPLVAVFVQPMPRSEEYWMNDAYRRFVVEELVPWVDEHYRTIASAESRAIVGGSRGALAALDLAWSHPETFGACGAIAPATSPLNLIDVIREGEVKPVRFFVLVGLYDRRFRPDGIALHDVLRDRGYDVKFLEIPEGHSLNAWSPYIDDVLAHLFPAEGETS